MAVCLIVFFVDRDFCRLSSTRDTQSSTQHTAKLNKAQNLARVRYFGPRDRYCYVRSDNIDSSANTIAGDKDHPAFVPAINASQCALQAEPDFMGGTCQQTTLKR